MAAYSKEKSQKSQETQAKVDNNESSALAQTKEEGEVKSIYTAEGLKKALEAKDADQISSQLNGLSIASANEIASNSELMDLIETQEDTVRNSIYDKIYLGIQDVDAISKIVMKRFGVALGTKYSKDSAALRDAKDLLKTVVNNNEYASYRADPEETMKTIEKEWTIEGCHHMYHVLSKAPEAHLAKLKIVMTTNTQLQSSAGGLAYSELGVYLLTYSDATIDAKDSNFFFHHKRDEKGEYRVDGVRYSVDESDANYGLNYFEHTAAHEFGHVVDKSKGSNYSRREDYRAITGWKQYNEAQSKAGAKEIVHDLRSYMSKPDPEGIVDSQEARDLVDEIAREVVIKNVQGEEGLKAKIDEVLNGGVTLTTEGVQKKTPQSKEITDSLDKFYEKNAPDANFADSLKKAPILNHLVRVTAGMQPWFHGEPFPELDKGRQIHSDYHLGTWYSYNTSAQEKKISCYQFCNPSEEFAELYSSYVSADDENRRTPEPLKTWLENNVMTEQLQKPSTTTSSSSSGSAGTSTTSSDDKKKDKKKKWWQFWKWGK